MSDTVRALCARDSGKGMEEASAIQPATQPCKSAGGGDGRTDRIVRPRDRQRVGAGPNRDFCLPGGKQCDDEERQEKQDVERDKQLQRPESRAIRDGYNVFHASFLGAKKQRKS
ncbi:hypothetical protein MESS4_230002 [Mesorhizobium sp. STM 4661]|nr:hypothetical protein MESS4_230002 [Mesorhizobium sp. STM 4661]